jgi:hypothetical protein
MTGVKYMSNQDLANLLRALAVTQRTPGRAEVMEEAATRIESLVTQIKAMRQVAKDQTERLKESDEQTGLVRGTGPRFLKE